MTTAEKWIIGLTSATLVLIAVQFFVTEARARRARAAKLVVEGLEVYDNPKVLETGRQMTVTLRNEGSLQSDGRNTDSGRASMLPAYSWTVDPCRSVGKQPGR